MAMVHDRKRKKREKDSSMDFIVVNKEGWTFFGFILINVFSFLKCLVR